jgi:hypothetical protein
VNRCTVQDHPLSPGLFTMHFTSPASNSNLLSGASHFSRRADVTTLSLHPAHSQHSERDTGSQEAVHHSPLLQCHHTVSLKCFVLPESTPTRSIFLSASQKPQQPPWRSRCRNRRLITTPTPQGP